MEEKRYLLLVDGKPLEGFIGSLEQAQTLAKPYMDRNLQLRIESYGERYGGKLAPSSIWRDDYDSEAWVEE
jgi:hypothetical protein